MVDFFLAHLQPHALLGEHVAYLTVDVFLIQRYPLVQFARILPIFLDVAKLWNVRSWLYHSRFLQPDIHVELLD